MEQDVWSQIVAFWNEAFPNIVDSKTDITGFIEHFPILKLAEQSRIFFAIHKLRDMSLEHHSRNTEEVLGISLEEFAEKKINAFYNVILSDHLKGILESIEHSKIFYTTMIDKKDVSDIVVYRCGLKLNHPKKGEIRLLWRSQVFETPTDLGNPQRTIIIIQDITHLMKSDAFWFRAAHKNNGNAIYITSRSDIEGYSTHDILSDREKEILKCLAEGKNTEQISKELFISKVTVSNHRQNMLNKIGAKDTTALIQLAKMTKII
jgi:DNA-binding CsgD family transcriptional regulator